MKSSEDSNKPFEWMLSYFDVYKNGILLTQDNWKKHMKSSDSLMIAPHEGRELEYVANGIKPLALLDRNKQPDQYGRAMDLQHVLVIRRQGVNEITITRKENEHLHDVFALLSSPKASMIIRSKKEKHIMLGRLFGYSEEQIRAFLHKGMQCACGQCSWDDPMTTADVPPAVEFVEEQYQKEYEDMAKVLQDELMERLQNNESFQ